MKHRACKEPPPHPSLAWPTGSPSACTPEGLGVGGCGQETVAHKSRVTMEPLQQRWTRAGPTANSVMQGEEGHEERPQLWLGLAGTLGQKSKKGRGV